MAKGLSISIGLNRVDPAHYQGWDGQLNACEFDANDMAGIAKAKGFETKVILTKEATSANVIKAISNAAQALETGDILFLTYSGHGGQVPDGNGDEPDGKDETWVLYDRQLVDDELYALWSKFNAGVRIFVLSDSCHSGSVTRAAFYEAIASAPAVSAALGASSGSTPAKTKALPLPVEEKTYSVNKELYDGLQRNNPDGDKVVVNASVLLISGCQDNQLSSDGAKNGLFTEKFLQVWKAGAFRTHRGFYRKVAEKMPPVQSPNYYKVGASNAKFERQSPLTI
jgi:metacaspase-1